MSRFGWKKIFDDKSCCKYNSYNIPNRKSIRRPYAIDKQNPVDGDFRCYEQLVLCQRTESDTHQLNIIIHDLPNAKCCNYNGKVIPFGETIIDAEVNQ